jgi:hypothetical protein
MSPSSPSETSSSETSFAERLSQIPAHLKIRVVHDDAVFVVIDKPCNLRSVPGHANPPPHPTNRKRPRFPNEEVPERRTGQEAWAAAIRTFRDKTVEEENCGACLQRLAATDSLIDSIPRKFKLFKKYVERNQKRLLVPDEAGKAVDIPATAKAMFERIQDRQRPLMNLPEPTRHEDSAIGQLILLGYEKNDISDAGTNSDESSTRLFVVHRLDCEVGAGCAPIFFADLYNPPKLVFESEFLLLNFLLSQLIFKDIWGHGVRQERASCFLPFTSLARTRKSFQNISGQGYTLATLSS